MIYIIMCGGDYVNFGKPKALTKIHGEKLIERTIRLLRENQVKQDAIKISSNNPLMEGHGVKVLHHYNPFRVVDGKTEGYWLDAFYPVDYPVCYLFGDVYYTEHAAKTIVDNGYRGNTLFGTLIEELKYWHEPLAYKVRKPEEFFNGIKAVKELYDQGKCERHPIVWELYRYLNGIDLNKHFMLVETYVHIENGGMDVDSIDDIAIVDKYFGGEK